MLLSNDYIQRLCSKIMSITLELVCLYEAYHIILST